MLRIAGTTLIFLECCIVLQSGLRNFLDRAYYKDETGVKEPTMYFTTQESTPIRKRLWNG